MQTLMRLSCSAAVVRPGQKFIFMFGAPGAGKGTYAKKLAKDMSLNQVSTGDEIRKILKGTVSKTFDKSLIETVRSIVTSGGLVNDDIVCKIIEEKSNEKESTQGMILDGFPRTQGQLDKYLTVFPVHCVFNVTLRSDVLLQKLMGRRTCSGCSTGYNICNINRDGYEMEPLLPKKEGICDSCGQKLIIREDDTEKVISARMVEYDAKTKPLLQVFEKMGVLLNFEAKKGVKDYPQIRSLIEKRLKQ